MKVVHVGKVLMHKSILYFVSQIKQNRAMNLGLIHTGSYWLLKHRKIELQGNAGHQFVQENSILTPKASLLLFRK